MPRPDPTPARARFAKRSCHSKHRYHDASDAKRMRHKRQAAGAGPLRIYPCDLCGGWHLTRKDAETSPAARAGDAQ